MKAERKNIASRAACESGTVAAENLNDDAVIVQVVVLLVPPVPKVARDRRGFDAVLDALEQRVADRVAQALKRIADGRLRETEPFGGACHISFQHQRCEDPQEVQVHRLENVCLHAAHPHYLQK